MKHLDAQRENFNRQEPQCFRRSDPDTAQFLERQIASRAFIGRWPNPLWVGLDDEEDEP